MSKRTRDDEGEDHRSTKRPKQGQKVERQPPEEIQFARQLQHLLAFRQDGIQQLQHGIASFKAFLDSILYSESQDDQPRRLSILREFLDGERPPEGSETERPLLNQLWQAWSFASQNNNDHLGSSINAILALLLKVLSSLIDFRDHGIALCRTVLQHQHLKLVKRALDAPKGKDFVMSPALRMLIEIASFDGGALAKEVYKRRELTFDIGTMRRNLGFLRTDIPEDQLHRRSSIRTWTVRYILTLLKYLHEGGRIDLLQSRPVCTALFSHLRNDPADLAKEILDITDKFVLKDSEIPKSTKAALLVQFNLEKVTEVATRGGEDQPNAHHAFEWLLSACTNPSYGLLRPSGWYPPGTTSTDDASTQQDTIDLGLDSIEFYDREGRPEVRNLALLSWLQTLRPQSNLREREVLLKAFTAAPELPAAYFAEKIMQADPKLSNTWIGYASFLFEVVRLPVPQFLGNEDEWAQLPPQFKIMIESILPQPLTQKVLTRCLNQPSELGTFFAIRLLILAFEKLAQVQAQLMKGSEASTQSADLWRAASDKLLTRFLDHCPKLKDVATAFRKLADDSDHALQREAFTKLLRLYYEVTPLHALDEPFDVSAPLITALEKTALEADSNELKQLRAMELENLLQIAILSTGVRWFNKQGSLQHSPAVMLLKMHRSDLQNQSVRELVWQIFMDSGILSSAASCDALIASLAEMNDSAFTVVGTFLDDCFLRASQRPIKYLDDINALDYSSGTDGARSPGLLIAVLLEQAPYVASKPADEKDVLLPWISRCLDLSATTDGPALSGIVENIRNELRLPTVNGTHTSCEELLSRTKITTAPRNNLEPMEHVQDSATTISFLPPPVESDNHPELLKWARRGLEIALQDEDVSALILCLCSEHPEIRAQALTQLYKLQESVHGSALDDKDAILVVLGEVTETYEFHCLPKSDALPYLAGTFATHALRVQMQPSHFMYPKINHYLNKGPEWRIQKMPTYWIQNTILAKPEEDDSYWNEAHWLLSWLVDGLRTPSDFEILRRAEVFERVMSFCGSHGAASRSQILDKVLELLWRGTHIEQGITALITRTGVLNWLDTIAERTGNAIVVALRERILQTCDRERIEEWSGMKLEEL